MSLLIAAGLTPIAPALGATHSSPDAPGPWDVGLTTIAIADPSSSAGVVPVDLWYPVDAEDASGSPAALNLLFAPLVLDEVLADPEPAEGTFPMVVFSHGQGGTRFTSFFLAQTLASHGFVVAAPDHVGDTAADFLFEINDPRPLAIAKRPPVISAVIDEMLRRNTDRTDPAAPLIDPQNIGVAGHSLGGWTTLAVAADPRVKAIMPIAPAFRVFKLASIDLPTIDIPTMVLSATVDATTPIEKTTEPLWGLLETQQTYRADLTGAVHESFLDACLFLQTINAVPGVPEDVLTFFAGGAGGSCGPDVMDIDRAHQITSLYAVSFFKKILGGDGSYTRYLTPAYPSRAGLEVEFYSSPGSNPLTPRASEAVGVGTP